MSLVLGLLVLTGGSAAVWAGITDPEGGLFAGLRNVIAGVPNTKHASTTAAAFISDVLAVGGGGGGAAAPAVAQAPTGPAPASGTRAGIVAAARTWLGVRYAFGGTTRAGVDCSGLTRAVYAANGVTIPRTAAMQQEAAGIIPEASAQPGDLVFFGYPAHHVGIWLGGGSVLHAPHTGTVVRVESLASIARSMPGSPVTFGNELRR